MSLGKKLNSESFKLSDFYNYKEIENQYEDSFIKKIHAVKVFEDNSIVQIACIDEEKNEVFNLLKSFHSPKKIDFITVTYGDFVEFVGNIVDSENEVKTTREAKQEFSLNEISEDSPIVNIINAICLEAIRKKASDIHLECENEYMQVRFRIDGVLHTVKTFKRQFFSSISSRIKVMASLNIMEQRLAQDGRMSVIIGEKKLDFRVSIVPVTKGESIVLRLFNNESSVMKLSELGYDKSQLQVLEHINEIPNGLILVTGPTGSGKTTTFHSLIDSMDKESLKIITIEDPVERQIEGIQQIQVNENIGFTFESIFRRVLRQDPDVIMVGEIRDNATAELAIRASLTGHKILATLHTNDSVSSISRLRNLGIESFLISSVLKYSIAQRLVRKICKDCKGKGCNKCSNTGYNGRTVVTEIMKVDDTISQMINENKTDLEIKEYLKKNHVPFLIDDAKRKVEAKITDTKELKREGLL